MTLSRMFCEKFQITPGIFLSSSAFMALDDFLLGPRPFRPPKPAPPAGLLDQARPVLSRPHRHEELGVFIALDVGAVVGPAGLRDDRLHLGVGRHDGPRLLGDLDIALQRLVERGGAANPQVALFQLGHELAADVRDQAGGAQEQDRHDGQERPAILEAELEFPQVAELQTRGPGGFPGPA